MGRHQVRNQILLLFQLFVHPAVLSGKFFIDRMPGLTKTCQHRIRYMLRRNLQLSAHMIPTQLFQKMAVLVRQHIVKPDTGTNKYLLHPGNGAQLSQQGKIIPVIRFQIRAL